MSNSDSEDQDWFNKDEDEILQSFQVKVSSDKSENNAGGVEYIHGSSEADNFLQEKRLEGSLELSVAAGVKKLPTTEMRKALNMEPINIFLFVTTMEYDFFTGQITVSDGLDRVLLYLRIWHVIFELELPGFQEELLQKFIKNESFLEQWRIIAAKLFRKNFKTIKNYDVDEILNAMKSLICRVHKSELMTPKIYHVIMHIRKLIEESDNRDIVQRHSCQQLMSELASKLEEKTSETEIFSSVDKMQLGEKSDEVDIYPSLHELQLDEKSNISEIYSPISRTTNTLNKLEKVGVADYLTKQKQLLREDFMIPLREYVCKIKKSESNITLPELYENVFIVLNADFINAKRHELVFIDILGTKRSAEKTEKKLERNMIDKIAAIKTGSLLLLTTSKSFEDLILATVTYTDGEMLTLGYIGIQILRQYNIGTVYKRPLLMFETPAFFEPYNNVYSYLTRYGDSELPMKRYIVDNEKEVNAPCYLKPDTSYSYDREQFNVTAENPSKPKKLSLNQSQWHAFCEALTKEFCLIQGPPGTGKTHISVHLIRTLIENVKTPIVLITYTNDSLDKFLLKLSLYTSNILRFGSQTRLPEISQFNVRFDSTNNDLTNPRLKRLYYVTNEEFKAKFQVVQQMHADFDGTEESYQRLLQAQRAVRDVEEKLKCIRVMFQFYAARKADVIAMTSTFAAKTNFLFRLLQSKVVIFEEAAELLESHVLACLTPYTEHVIMIGDHMQLRPYTSSHHSFSRHYDFNISLFERLFVNNLKGPTLNLQYRMRPCIADLIHPTFYTDLNNDVSVENYPKIRNMLSDLYFYTHNKDEFQSKDECSIYNDFEITETLKLAKHLIKKASYTAADIVILSPYAKQVENMKVKAETFLKKIQLNITTVDSFQGLEANIVLLSLVRSNSKEQIGFLNENNRICVALSRAKHGLYIIGNMPLLAKCSKTWRIIEEKLKTQGHIGSKFPVRDDNE